MIVEAVNEYYSGQCPDLYCTDIMVAAQFGGLVIYFRLQVMSPKVAQPHSFQGRSIEPLSEKGSLAREQELPLVF